MKLPKSFFAFAALLLVLPHSVMPVFAQPSTPRDSTWITDGNVNAMAYSKGLTYIGGDFTYVGQNIGYGAALSTTTGAPNLKFPKVNGPIEVVTADGTEGWYIGGSFTKVGDFTRNGLAHINADGTVDPNWDPAPADNFVTNTSTIHAIIVNGSTVYVGGSFTSIGGQQRKGIAALNAATGQATSWNPNASHIVRAMAIHGANMYVAGDFDAIGGQSRKFLAALDTTIGNATAWNPALNGRCYAIVVSDTLLFAGGAFTSAGGQVRNYLAAFGITSGQVTTWNPGTLGDVYVLVAKGSTLYVGGNFKAVGGLPRSYIAALSFYSNTPLSWNPISNGPIREICLNGSTIYVAGNFNKIDGQTRYRIAAFDETTGKATAWISHASGPVHGLATNSNGTVFYAGGEFTSIGGQLRNRLAALNASTGIATPWNPNATIDGSIYAMAISGSNVYIGGTFTKIGNSARNRLAAINTSTGALTAWNPNANGFAHDIIIDNSTVYVCGTFRVIGNQTRIFLAALDLNTGLVKSWNPNISTWKLNNGGGAVYTILLNGATIYAGGDFSSAGFQLREAIAAIDVNTGQVTEWNPNLNAFSIVHAMALDGSTLYIGGDFNTVKGQTRNRLAAVDISTADPTGWNPNPNGIVVALLSSGANVYATGGFTSIGAQARKHLAAVDKATGIPTDWNPSPNHSAARKGLIAVGSAILAGGPFTTMGENIQDHFAQFGNIVAANNPPNAPSAINQYNPNGTTVIPEGGTTSENKATFKATITDPDNDQIKLQIELRKTIEAFTGVPTHESSLANSGAAVSITIDTLSAADYKWRYRAMDALGLATAWVEFGTPGNTDFVNTTIPLPAATAYGNILGGDRSHSNKVTYIFPGQAGHFYLSFQVYDIDIPDEVGIVLNNGKIANVPLTANNQWSGDLGVVLPDGLVNNANSNLVAFDNTKNPPGALLWGVRQVSIENCFELPSTGAYGKIIGGDQAHADRVIYWFPGQTGDMNLTYEVYDIDNTDELDVLLNGKKNRDEAITANNDWSMIRTLLLPDSLVNDANANVVVFDNTKNPPNVLNWGIRNVSVALIAVNKPPAAPAALNQLQVDGITAIAEGGTTSENKVVFKGTVSDPDGEQVKLQIELRKIAEAFTGTPNLQSSLVNSGASATITAENIASANYKWRFRAMDARGLANAWAEFGTPGNTDFSVNVPPSIPVYPAAASSQLIGEEFLVNIYVGTEAKPVSKLFGMGFVLEFTQTDYIDVATPYANSFIPTTFMGNGIVLHHTVEEEAGKVSVGISRLYGHSTVNGFGPVLRVKFVSRPNTPEGTQVKFSISNVTANDSLGNPLPLSPVAIKNITFNPSETRTVWPGDTNNDGAVNQTDILPLGLYWGSTGPIRPNASIQFNGQSCPSWTPPMATYADATGDGVVNQSEVAAIGLHWGKVHSLLSPPLDGELEKNQTPASATIMPEIIPAEQPPNQEFFVRIKVAEVSGLFGLAFELVHDQPKLLNVLAVESDSLLGNDVVFYPHIDAANGKIAVGTSRKAGQASINGSGAVVRVKAKIAASATAGTKINFTLQNVKANDANGTALNLTPQAKSLTVSNTTEIDSNRETPAPTSYRLHQNHPNPFNAGTLIKYEIPQAGPVSLKIYNLAGQEVLEIVNALQQPGRYQINWDGRDSEGRMMPSGVYICRIQAGSFVKTQRMVMVR